MEMRRAPVGKLPIFDEADVGRAGVGQRLTNEPVIDQAGVRRNFNNQNATQQRQRQTLTPEESWECSV
jgi:hypothetical protein